MSTSKTVLTDSQLATIRTALASIIGIVGSADFTAEGHTPVALPAAKDCTVKEEEIALVRCVFALQAKEEESRRAVLISAKKGVDAKMHVVRLAAVEAYREIAALSPAVKLMLGDKAAPPASASLPVSEVIECFPEGTTEAQALALLHRMNYKLVAGAKRDNVKKLIVHIGADFLSKQLAATRETEETSDESEGDTQG